MNLGETTIADNRITQWEGGLPDKATKACFLQIKGLVPSYRNPDETQPARAAVHRGFSMGCRNGRTPPDCARPRMIGPGMDASIDIREIELKCQKMS